MTNALYPPLSIIAAGLRGQDAERSDGDAPENAAPQHEADLVMPPFLRELVARKVASQQAYPQAPLASGQIRALSAVKHADGSSRPLGRTAAVLLGASQGGRRWSGWLVAQESDYAGERDLLCEQEDGPVAPEAAKVQCWNPVECLLSGDEPVLGILAPRRLDAVRRLEGPLAHGQFVAPRPGRIGAWNLDADTVVVTGTPLGEADDPRHQYQALYLALATELRAAAMPCKQTRQRPAWPGRLSAFLVKPAWTFAATALVLVQAGWLLALHVPADDTVYRGAGAQLRANPCAPTLRAVFRADASYADVVIAVRRVGGALIDGPSETGEVWVVLPSDQQAQEAANILRQSAVVEAADVLPVPAKCRR